MTYLEQMLESQRVDEAIGEALRARRAAIEELLRGGWPQGDPRFYYGGSFGKRTMIAAHFDLDRMRTLLRKLGNPQDQFKAVHVAGTKGKGSTCAMVAAMLGASGYKVGLYTSPHLVDIRERVQINGVMIPTAVNCASFAAFITRRTLPKLIRLSALSITARAGFLSCSALRYFGRSRSGIQS